MSRTIQNDHGQVFDVASQSSCDVLEVVFHWRIDIHHSARRWSNDDLVHVNIGRVEQTTALGRSQYGDGVVCSERTEVRAFEWVNGDINLRTRLGNLLACVKTAADLLADVEHWRF